MGLSEKVYLRISLFKRVEGGGIFSSNYKLVGQCQEYYSDITPGQMNVSRTWHSLFKACGESMGRELREKATGNQWHFKLSNFNIA